MNCDIAGGPGHRPRSLRVFRWSQPIDISSELRGLKFRFPQEMGLKAAFSAFSTRNPEFSPHPGTGGHPETPDLSYHIDLIENK